MEAHPTVIAAYYFLIDALLRDDRFPQAMEVCDKLGKVDYSLMVPHYRGLITWRSGDRAGALKIWEQMVRDFPEDDFVWGLYAEDYALTGDYAGALERLNKAKSLQKEPSTTYWEVGALYHELAGDIPGAIVSLEKVLTLLTDEGQTEGAWVDSLHREIGRLQKQLD
ncbi:MAG: hypothetical protein K2F83_07425 [Oscillospiraceae bacterium]|nr:hypothetical protein [Oscillospiraceae bacterium]